MTVFAVISAIKEGVDTINTIKGWFDGAGGSFDASFQQINQKLDNILTQVDALTGLAKNILTAVGQVSNDLLVSDINHAYGLAETAVLNMQSYRLSGSQGDLDNARNNSIQALVEINNIAAVHPDQAQLLLGPLVYVLGVRLRVGRELDDGAFASSAYSQAIQETVTRISGFADSIDASLSRAVPVRHIETFQDDVTRPPIITTVTSWEYTNTTGTFTASYVKMVERQGTRILSQEEGGSFTERLGTDGPVVRSGSFADSPSAAEAEGHRLDLQYLGITALRADAVEFDLLNNGLALAGGEGPDALAGGSARDLLEGGGGDDTLSGLGAQDALRGGAGNDRLDGGTEADVLRGGDGDDTLFGGAGDDTIDGQLGLDWASYADAPTGVTVSLALAGPQNTGHGVDLLLGLGSLEGSAFADRLTGNAGANNLRGGGGNDTLDGGDGDDTLHGQAGDDALAGGTGRDLLRYDDAPGGVVVDLAAGMATGAAGTDAVSGIEDVLGDAAADALRGDAAANLLDGSGGSDTLEGREGNDTLRGDGGGADAADHLSGGGGDDRIEALAAGGAADALEGGFGRDTFVLAGLGGGVADIILDFQPGAGGDVLDLSILGPLDGQDAFLSGRLRLVQTATGTELQIDTDAGPAHAYATLAVLQGVTAADLQAINFSPAAGFEQRGWLVLGGPGDDTLVGSGFGESIAGADGNDLLIGHGGRDRLDGGEGVDTASYADARAGVTVRLTTGEASGGDGNDLLTSIENLIGSAFGDRLKGDGGANLLRGGDGRDVLEGGGGNDRLVGGGDGDVLNGGAGQDSLTGGQGPDVFVVAPGSGADSILDFLPGTDRLDLSAFGFTRFNQVLARATDVGADLRIVLGGGDEVLLLGVQEAQLAAADVILA